MRLTSLILGALGVLVSMDGLGVAADPPSLDEATSQLRVREGFHVQAIASEPLIQDPVSARFDYHGRLWVVEMPDYPTGPRDGKAPSGAIKLLTDNDGDGVMDKSTVFAKGLLFATGVQPYQNGAFVTQAGSIVWMEDTNADGVADETETLFQGFTAANEQLRANHPTLGPDGMIYVAGGLRGGKVNAVSSRYEKRDEPVDIRDRDFCFDPNGGKWYAVSGKSQFGQSIDDFGRRVGCSNRNPAITMPLSLAAIDRNPLLVPRDALHDIASAAEKSRVVSIAEAWTTSNLHSGQFSAACGVCAPGLVDEATGKEWILTCEPTSYVVQRQFVTQTGSVWTSEREPIEAEFFASKSTWFRPVDAIAGPDDSVFVVDMARAVIEHPDFMPAELKNRDDKWDGMELGRIWRISRSTKALTTPKIKDAHDAIKWIQSPNPWAREMASHYLLENGIGDASDQLVAIIKSEQSPTGAARAARVLANSDLMTEQTLGHLVGSNDARVRAIGVELAVGHQGVFDSVLSLASDLDELVRRTVAEYAVRTTGDQAKRIAALSKVASNGDIDRWTRRTVGCVPNQSVERLVQSLVARKERDQELLEHLVERYASMDADGAARAVIASRVDGALPERDRLAALSAWCRGVKRKRMSPKSATEKSEPAIKDYLLGLVDDAGARALDSGEDAAFRALCIDLCNDFGVVNENLRELLTGKQPSEVKDSALRLLARHDKEWTREYLAENLSSMTSGLRKVAVAVMTSSTDHAKWLLTSIEAGAIPKHFIDPATSKRLSRHGDKTVKTLASKLFKPNASRAAVIQQYASAATQLGDPHVGKRLFVEHCSACHRIDGVGTNVGPDISDSRVKTPEVLLASILDPNAAIDAAFVQYTALTDDGQVVDGLLIGETADTITLAKKGGTQTTLNRDEIERFQSPGTSLMPEGFEQNINVESMANLIAYLKSWRYLKTEIPGAIERLQQAK